MAEKLLEYNLKRNFEKTPEPQGETKNREEGLRFVVQRHMARSDHFDFRLELNGVLLSWAVPKGPSPDTRHKRLAVRVEDHPLKYRDFEGTIPKGEYGGGTVMLWDEGFWEPRADAEEGLRQGSLKFILKGRRLKGKWALILMKRKTGESRDSWLLLKEKDEFTETGDAVSKFITSVRTGRTMAEIQRGEDEKTAKNPFENTGVQLAKLVNTPPGGEDWIFELKYDGYRILAYLEGSRARLVTRGGSDYTEKFREAAGSLLDFAAGRAMVLDGEMVVTDKKGRTDFQALQGYMKNPGGKSLIYIVFDLLALDGVDLRGRPLMERKEILESLMRGAPKNLYYSKHVRGNGAESFMAACESNLEGIIGKKADSIYSGTRNGDWIKLKCGKRQEFVIGGYTLSDKKASGISSLLLGVYEGNTLIYAGRAGTGFSRKAAEDLEKKFRGITQDASPFRESPSARKNEKITWLNPRLIAEIKFAEWTADNLLRQASFKGLRTDKSPEDIKREIAAHEPLSNEKPEEEHPMDSEKTIKDEGLIICGIKITNPDKTVFPRVTKGDVARYYAEISEQMLPYVEGRILSVVRCPKGLSAPCFYRKHPGPGSKGTEAISISAGDGKTEDYFYIRDVSGLIYEAQMGALEFHTWGSRAENPEKPDIMVFDLDPDEGLPPERVRQGAKDLKSLLSQLSLTAFLKTSGGKGYHVVVPIRPSADWDAFRDFARNVARVMEQKWPERYTSNIRKVNRENKIFIDWIRNGRGATSIAPYSLRARKGARVSMPISWEELDTALPDSFGIPEALSRAAGAVDPWKDFFNIGQSLK